MKIGNTCVSRQKLSAPPAILQSQFIQLAKQVASQFQRMKIRMVRWEEVWNKFNKEWKRLELYIAFQNWREE